jgi:hypothetical protein
VERGGFENGSGKKDGGKISQIKYKKEEEIIWTTDKAAKTWKKNLKKRMKR